MSIISLLSNSLYYITCPFCGKRILIHKRCPNCGHKFTKEEIRALLKSHTALIEEEIDKALELYDAKDEIILPIKPSVGSVASAWNSYASSG